MPALGLHLAQDRRRADGPWRSVLAAVDDEGVLSRLDPLGDDAEIAAAIAGHGPCLLAVDAPLVAPAEGGRRDIERVLGWCDIPCMPVGRRRLVSLTGGVRGEELAAALGAAGANPWEGSPDQVLRQLMWERDHPGPGVVPLIEYRSLWPALRAPRYRPKLGGRAHPGGLLAAWSLLAGALDLGGWAPDPTGSDERHIADAARLDALCMALVAHRRGLAPPRATGVGTPDRGRMLVATGPELEDRLERTLQRMRAEGDIGI